MCSPRLPPLAAFQGPGPSSLLDPLLAGLVSVCVATAAVTSVVLCLRFRQQAGRPEFQRLQDVPMVRPTDLQLKAAALRLQCPQFSGRQLLLRRLIPHGVTKCVGKK